MGNRELEEFEEEELDSFTITDPDGVEHEFAIVASFSIGQTDYVAVRLVAGTRLVEDKVYFYRYQETPGDPDSISLDEIESDEEMTLVCDTYEDLCSEGELE